MMAHEDASFDAPPDSSHTSKSLEEERDSEKVRSFNVNDAGKEKGGGGECFEMIALTMRAN